MTIANLLKASGISLNDSHPADPSLTIRDLGAIITIVINVIEKC